MASSENSQSPRVRPSSRAHSGRPGRSRSRSPKHDDRRRRRRDGSRSHDQARRLPENDDNTRTHSDRSRRAGQRERISRSRSRERSRKDDTNTKTSTSDRHHRSSHRSSRHHHHHRSRSPKCRKHTPSPSRSRSPPPPRRSRAPLPSQEASLQLAQGHSPSTALAAPPPKEKEKTNFKPTGLLAAETNKVTLGTGAAATEIVLKYHEPAEARKPAAADKWTLFVFKGTQREPLETVALHERSCWLFGREAAVADVPIAHPSCSKQHAVLQFRYTTKVDEFGERRGKVGLYLLDLESSNGTWLNGKRMDGARYVGVLSGDVVRFGDSEREYVLLLPPKGG